MNEKNNKTKEDLEDLKSDSGYEYVLCSLFGFKLGVEFPQAHKPVVSIDVVYCSYNNQGSYCKSYCRMIAVFATFLTVQ